MRNGKRKVVVKKKARRLTEDIRELAAWLHEASVEAINTYRGREADETPGLPFCELKEMTKKRYYYVAERLLTHPPSFMRQA